MADMENFLLEAAGRSGGSSGSRHFAPSSRRRRENACCDDGSASKVKDWDENRGYGGRKFNWSQLPLKKRGKIRDNDQGSRGKKEDAEGSSRGGGGDDSDGRSNLYKDEDDRQQPVQLTELDRELVLSEPALKLDDKKLQERVKSMGRNDSKSQSKRESTPLAFSNGVHTSNRAALKADALNEWRLKQMKQQGLDASRSGSRSQGYSSLEKKSSLPSAGVSSSSQSDSERDSQSKDGRSKRCQRINDEMSKAITNIATYEEIRGITIRRSKLAKWFMEPFFEDLIVGCFVRVGIGMRSGQSIYRLCIVRNVDASDPDKQYMLENKMTYKYLNCVWGSERSAARWQMARMSDSPPLEEEYNQWKKEVERTGGRMPTKHEVATKKEEIKQTNSFVYSAETVKHMLQEKKSAAIRPYNIAAERERLRREMEAAEYKNDESQLEKIQARLEKLAAVRQEQDSKNPKAHRLAELNKKNRVENFKNASELKPKKSVEGGSDPCSRKWTRLTNRATDDPSEIAERNKGVKAGVVATDAVLVASLDAGKLVDTSAPVDQWKEPYMLHNFDLPISLNTLQKFGGSQGVLAGAMARRQKIEATIGLPVPDNDGQKHASTLSVSEYKRRRGML